MEKVTAAKNRMCEDRNEDVIEIDVVELLFALRKKLRMIIPAAMIGRLGAGIYNKVILNLIYTPTSMACVLSKETTFTSLVDLQMGSQLIKDYSVVITNRPVLEEVTEKQKLSLSYNQLKSTIRVSNPADTRILDMSVLDTDPVKVKVIVDVVAKTSSSYIGDIMKMTPPKIIKSGVVPDNPTPSNIEKNIVLEGLTLPAAARGFITLQVIMNDTTRSGEDVSRYLGISVLAAIPESNIEGKDSPEKSSEGKRNRKKRKIQAKRAKRRK